MSKPIDNIYDPRRCFLCQKQNIVCDLNRPCSSCKERGMTHMCLGYELHTRHKSSTTSTASSTSHLSYPTPYQNNRHFSNSFDLSSVGGSTQTNSTPNHVGTNADQNSIYRMPQIDLTHQSTLNPISLNSTHLNNVASNTIHSSTCQTTDFNGEYNYPSVGPTSNTHICPPTWQDAPNYQNIDLDYSKLNENTLSSPMQLRLLMPAEATSNTCPTIAPPSTLSFPKFVDEKAKLLSDVNTKRGSLFSITGTINTETSLAIQSQSAVGYSDDSTHHRHSSSVPSSLPVTNNDTGCSVSSFYQNSNQSSSPTIDQLHKSTSEHVPPKTISAPDFFSNAAINPIVSSNSSSSSSIIPYLPTKRRKRQRQVAQSPSISNTALDQNSQENTLETTLTSTEKKTLLLHDQIQFNQLIFQELIRLRRDHSRMIQEIQLLKTQQKHSNQILRSVLSLKTSSLTDKQLRVTHLEETLLNKLYSKGELPNALNNYDIPNNIGESNLIHNEAISPSTGDPMTLTDGPPSPQVDDIICLQHSILSNRDGVDGQGQCFKISNIGNDFSSFNTTLDATYVMNSEGVNAALPSDMPSLNRKATDSGLCAELLNIAPIQLGDRSLRPFHSSLLNTPIDYQGANSMSNKKTSPTALLDKMYQSELMTQETMPSIQLISTAAIHSSPSEPIPSSGFPILSESINQHNDMVYSDAIAHDLSPQSSTSLAPPSISPPSPTLEPASSSLLIPTSCPSDFLKDVSHEQSGFQLSNSLQGLLGNLPFVIFNWNSMPPMIQNANTAFCTLFNYEQGEVIKMDWRLFIHPQYLERTICILKRARERQETSIQFPQVYVDRKCLPFVALDTHIFLNTNAQFIDIVLIRQDLYLPLPLLRDYEFHSIHLQWMLPSTLGNNLILGDKNREENIVIQELDKLQVKPINSESQDKIVSDILHSFNQPFVDSNHNIFSQILNENNKRQQQPGHPILNGNKQSCFPSISALCDPKQGREDIEPINHLQFIPSSSDYENGIALTNSGLLSPSNTLHYPISIDMEQSPLVHSFLSSQPTSLAPSQLSHNLQQISRDQTEVNLGQSSLTSFSPQGNLSPSHSHTYPSNNIMTNLFSCSTQQPPLPQHPLNSIGDPLQDISSLQVNCDSDYESNRDHLQPVSTSVRKSNNVGSNEDHVDTHATSFRKNATTDLSNVEMNLADIFMPTSLSENHGQLIQPHDQCQITLDFEKKNLLTGDIKMNGGNNQPYQDIANMVSSPLGPECVPSNAVSYAAPHHDWSQWPLEPLSNTHPLLANQSSLGLPFGFNGKHHGVQDLMKLGNSMVDGEFISTDQSKNLFPPIINSQVGLAYPYTHPGGSNLNHPPESDPQILDSSPLSSSHLKLNIGQINVAADLKSDHSININHPPHVANTNFAEYIQNFTCSDVMLPPQNRNQSSPQFPKPLELSEPLQFSNYSPKLTNSILCDQEPECFSSYVLPLYQDEKGERNVTHIIQDDQNIKPIFNEQSSSMAYPFFSPFCTTPCDNPSEQNQSKKNYDGYSFIFQNSLESTLSNPVVPSLSFKLGPSHDELYQGLDCNEGQIIIDKDQNVCSASPSATSHSVSLKSQEEYTLHSVNDDLWSSELILQDWRSI